MEIFIGIDQSINSTGITIQKFEDDKKISKEFFIIKPNKLTKKENDVNCLLNDFEYITYIKKDKKDCLDNNDFELSKVHNVINISDKILDLINSNVKNKLDKLYIALEGISFQSSQTKSLIDLSGLSYIIRYRILNYFMSHQDQLGGLFILTPGEIKKFATGNGNAKKDSMIALFENLNPSLKQIQKNDDLADSYWISEYLININKKCS